MTNRIEIYDTTLRDGSQGEGVNFSVEDKCRVAEQLDAFGVDFIEGGWPGSNPRDLAFFERVRDLKLTHARVAAFGATRRHTLTCEDDPSIQSLLKAETPVVTIFGKSWLLHVKDALRLSPEENLEIIEETMRYLSARASCVIYDAEHFFDGYKTNPEYALATLRAAAGASPYRIVLCDTNGGSLPETVARVTREVLEQIDVPLGIHCHNDGELAVANTLAAVSAGCVHVQGTINGYGERCGNANLCSVIPNLELKLGLRCLPPGSLPRLTATSRCVGEVANRTPNGHQPFVGRSALAHKAGIHVSAIERTSRAYEHIDPARVGNETRVLVSDQMGASNVLNRARALGIDLSGHPETMRLLVERVKELEYTGYQFENAEGSFTLLVLEALERRPRFFTLVDYRVLLTAAGSPEATVRVRVGDGENHAVSLGVGPAHALDLALRHALASAFPEIGELKLVDFKVRILDGHDGTAARTRVHIEMGDPERTWSTTGVDPDIIAATIHALVEGYEYGLLLRRTAGVLSTGAPRVAASGDGTRPEAQAGGAGASGNVTLQPRGEGRLPIVILNEIDPGRSEIGA